MIQFGFYLELMDILRLKQNITFTDMLVPIAVYNWICARTRHSNQVATHEQYSCSSGVTILAEKLNVGVHECTENT